MGKRSHGERRKTCERGHALSGEGPCATCAEHAVRDGLESPASALDVATRGRMESSFGFDFEHVRVHDGPRAASAADALDAEAFTVGRDVVLGRSAPRDRILAHELAHVVQQGGREVSPQGSFDVGPIGDAREREAEAAAHAVGSGSSARVSRAESQPMVQRAPKEEAKKEEAAPAPASLAKSDDFSDCSTDKKKEIQDRANEARIWVNDAHAAAKEVGSGGGKPAVKELFARQFRFDPADANAKGLMSEVETSYAKMKEGTDKKLTFTCANREGGRAAEAKSGFLSCAGHVTIFDEFFQSELPGFNAPEDIARDQKFRTHILVHELAHNLAGREGEVRPDYTPTAYGCERQWPSWDQLGAKDAVNNAETYALFAQQVQDKK